MKTPKIFTLAVLLLTLTAYPQSNKLDKKMEKIRELAEKNKLKEADESLEKLLAENPSYGPGWDYLSKIRFKEYKEAKKTDMIFENITVTTKDKKGNEVQNDSITNSLMNVLQSVKPSKVAWNKYLYTLRKGTLHSNDAYTCSYTLRNIYVDIEIDTAVSKKALKYFNNAEEEFQKKNYESAAKLYRRAVEEQPDFYKASLYMGDCFFFTEDYPNAISSFKSAVEKFPFLIEPRKYLIDSYQKSRLYDKMLDESIAAMAVYPDQVVSVKLEDAAYYLDKKLNIKWTPRAVFPNVVLKDSIKSDVNAYKEENAPQPTGPWTHYAAALPKVQAFCDEKGILAKNNQVTASRYLEVYSWEEMLKNSTDPSLEEARKMQKEGYLDCYVLVTCYHYDVYPQYSDFVAKNKEKVADYYRKFIVAK